MKPILLLLLTALPLWAAPKKLLYLAHMAGHKHESVPLSIEVVTELGRKSRAFAVNATADCSVLTRENLRQYAAVMFNTTGELPMDQAQKEALLDFVKNGGGFLGVHSATDTFYKWPAYGELIGGYFVRHPWHQEVTVRVEDEKDPVVRHLAPSFRIHDEIYQLRDFSRQRSHVLLSLDTWSVDLRKARDNPAPNNDYPLAWIHNYGRGRVFYTALGHRKEVWQDARFQTLLVNAIRWAMGGK